MMLENRLRMYRSAQGSPVAKLIRSKVVAAADDLEAFAGMAAERVPGSELAEWIGGGSAERLVGHLRALAWMCRSASACIVGETN